MEKGQGCLTAVVVAVLFAIFGIGALVNGAEQMFDSYWQGKSNYELASAAANAVRADTAAAHGLDARTLALVLLPVGVMLLCMVGFFLYSAWREAQMMRMLSNSQRPYNSMQNTLPACLPKHTYALLEAPERENTYTPIWAGR